MSSGRRDCAYLLSGRAPLGKFSCFFDYTSIDLFSRPDHLPSPHELPLRDQISIRIIQQMSATASSGEEEVRGFLRSLIRYQTFLVFTIGHRRFAITLPQIPRTCQFNLTFSKPLFISDLLFLDDLDGSMYAYWSTFHLLELDHFDLEV